MLICRFVCCYHGYSLEPVDTKYAIRRPSVYVHRDTEYNRPAQEYSRQTNAYTEYPATTDDTPGTRAMSSTRDMTKARDETRTRDMTRTRDETRTRDPSRSRDGSGEDYQNPAEPFVKYDRGKASFISHRFR
jgi:hypothetical protein